MQQTHQAMSGRHLLHDLHGQLVVVGGDVGGTVNRSQFMLRRSYLVVLCLGKDAELPQFPVQIRHILSHPGLDGAEIVIVHLLPFWRLCAKQLVCGYLVKGTRKPHRHVRLCQSFQERSIPILADDGAAAAHAG